MKKKTQTPEQKQKADARRFKMKITRTLQGAGFEYINTENKHIRIGSRDCEFDSVFLYENILLVCEDTISKESNIREHLRGKKEAAREVQANPNVLLEWLKRNYNEFFDKFNSYLNDRYKIFFPYFTLNEIILDEDDLNRFEPMKVVEPQTLNYFYKMSRSICKSSKYDIFRFLKLKSSDIGIVSPDEPIRSIKATIICPKEVTGLRNGVRIVSFMLSAETLIKNSYVLRKDNWEDTIHLYQRLIEKERIMKIRSYLAKRKETFLNNIIVSLPQGVTFCKVDNSVAVSLSELDDYGSYKINIPDDINSIGIIDGQHRIYAHFEGNDKAERIIENLRRQLNLLVTGIIFPENMSNLERSKYESRIFLDINSNSKPVPPDVLLHIKTLQDPFSDIAIARKVIERMNKRGIFKNRFELSLLEKDRIKIASIIKFALRYLVAIKPSRERTCLINFFDLGKQELLSQENDANLLNEYINFIVSNLNIYFSALKEARPDDWNDNESRILSVTSINGFIIALNDSLSSFSLLSHEEYKDRFSNLTIDFKKGNFPYTSSQYKAFSKKILEQAFLV